MAQQYQMLIPVQGIQRPILPEISLLRKNLFEKEKQLYEQSSEYSGLVDLSSAEINVTARSVKPENPTKEFITYARKHSTLGEQDIKQAYAQLHEQIWHKYWIRAREFLVWLPSEVIHPRIISEDLTSEVTSILIRDYKVTKDEKFNLSDINPDPHVGVNWLRQKGNIKKEMKKLLGVSNDTYVLTNSNPTYYEGLRALVLDFRDYVRPVLDSGWTPWHSLSDMGSLLSRKQ